MGFRCFACDTDIPHPHVDGECDSDPLGCKALVDQGARPVWIRIESDPRERGRDYLLGGYYLLSRGGWLCRVCAEHHRWPRGGW